MGNIFSALGDALSKAWKKSIWGPLKDLAQGMLDIVGDLATILWKELFSPVVEEIFGLLGFNDRTVLSGSVSISPILSYEYVDPFKKMAINRVINGTDMVSDIKDIFLFGIQFQTDRYYSYGVDHYTNGIPELSMSGLGIDIAAVQTQIDSEESPNTVEIQTITIGAYTMNFWCYKYMQDNPATYQFNENTNQIVYGGTTYTLAATPFSFNTGNGSFDIHTTLPSTIVDTIPDFVDARTYLVTYKVLPIDGTTPNIFWDHIIIDDTDPLVTTQGEADNLPGALPIIPILADGVMVDDDVTSELYITSDHILKTINIDITQLIDQLDITNNPTVEDAFVVFGVNIALANSQAEYEYLYLFLSNLHANSSVSYAGYDPLIPENQNHLTIVEGKYNLAITYAYVRKETLTGNVATVDEFTKQIIATDYQLIIQKQISETEYEQLTMFKTLAVTLLDNTVADNVLLVPLDMIGEDNGGQAVPNNMTFPILGILTTTQPILRQKEVLSKALHFCVYNEVITELAYYETEQFMGLFNFVVTVVSIIMLLPSGGTSASWSTIMGNVAKYYATQFILEAVLKELLLANPNSDVAKVLAVALSIGVSIYTGKNTNNFSLIMNSVTATSNTVGVYVDIESAKLEDAYEEFAKMDQDRQDDLKERFEDLNNITDLSMEITNMVIYQVEDASDFYDRTLNPTLTDKFLDLSAGLDLTLNLNDNKLIIT